MGKTKIAWCDYTWNVVTGCSKISEGCRFCFAEKMARRLAGRAGYPEAPNHFDVILRHDRLDQPLSWKKPGRVFVCSMGDLFHESASGYSQDCIMATVAKAPQHIYQFLTKRPGQMLKFVRETEDQQYDRWDRLFPNVWLGVSIENQQVADERIPVLLQTPAAVRFVSVEPMLGPVILQDDQLFGKRYLTLNANHLGIAHNLATGHTVDCRGVRAECFDCRKVWVTKENGIDWVIIGCESGPGRRPMELEWAIDLVKQCKAADVPVFVKQIEVNGKVSHDPAEWPEILRVQEYPEEKWRNTVVSK